MRTATDYWGLGTRDWGLGRDAKACTPAQRRDAVQKRNRAYRSRLNPTAGRVPVSLQSYKDLDVWKLGVELAATVDDLSEKLIRNRRFAMANQLSRAALSVR